MPGRKRRHYELETHVEAFEDGELHHHESVVFVDTVSADGKRVIRHETNTFTPRSPVRTAGTTMPDDGSQPAEDAFLPWDTSPPISLDEAIDDDGGGGGGGEGRSKRKNAYFSTAEHDAFLTEWTGERDRFLSELLRLEGLRDSTDTLCPHCPTGSSRRPEYRCRDCFGGELLCAVCCRAAHVATPFHNISKWNGRHFEKSTLRELGFVLHVGHPAGSVCPSPKPGPVDFMVIDVNGLHPVSIMYCDCDRVERSGDVVQQLLRRELYPATISTPTTCFTFRLLNTFLLLTLQSKINAYDFYMSLTYMSDNAGLGPTHDRLKAFLRAVREWRHMKALKRAGRGHEPGGVNATAPGELCLRCPACPRPGYNLPPGWENAPDDIKYIYTLFIAIDANFRLRRRAISNDQRDPPLGSGWGHFVERRSYNDHLLRYVDQEEISTCTGFAALQHANTKFSQGYAQTGCAIALCARHGFIGPQSVGDLQKGERYCNIDYVVASTLWMFGGLPFLVLTYDIMCQWMKHFKERLENFPAHLRINLPDGEVRYAIPKYHFNAHKEKDHNRFSLNLMPGVGRTDGEEIERNWSRHDGTAASTREMGPGSREDTLESHFDYANWRKFCGMGDSLRKKHKETIQDSAEYGEIFSEFSQRLDPENVATWMAMVVAYERDPSAPDPCYRAATGLTEADIKLQLAEEDLAAAYDGNNPLHDVSPSSMLIELLEAEDQQRRFRLRYMSVPRETAVQTTEYVKKAAALRRRIAAARAIQAVYMPPIPRLIAMRDSQILRSSAASSARDPTKPPPDLDAPEQQALFLPHQLSRDDLDLCHPGLAEIELRLRDGQLHDTLDKLRVQLHVKSRMMNFKGRNVRHQGPNTTMRRRLDANDAKIIALAEKYRAARRAKLAIAGPGPWEQEYRILAREDVRTMSKEDWSRRKTKKSKRTAQQVPEGPSEGKRKPSWIWMSTGRGELGETGAEALPGMSDALRGEFLRCRSRAKRYGEQVNHVVEEKRRTLDSLEKMSQTWDRRESLDHASDEPAVQQGAAAYAAKQASLLRGLAAKFKRQWATVDGSPSVSLENAEPPPPPPSTTAEADDEIRLPADIDSDDEALHLDEASDSDDD